MEATAHIPSVEVISMATLTVWVARDVGADAIIRGLRAVSDFEAEMQMAQMNNHLSGVETIFIPTSPEVSFMASKLVRVVWALRRVRLGLRARAGREGIGGEVRGGGGAEAVKATASSMSTRRSRSRRSDRSRSSTNCST